ATADAPPLAGEAWETPAVRRFGDRLRANLRWIVPIPVIFVVLCFVRYPLRVTEPCTVAGSERRYVRAEIAGFLKDVLVAEGSEVHAGQVLAELDDRELKASLAETDAQVA